VAVADAILYNGEAELLRVRCRELAGAIDRLVIVEALETFQGQPKAQYLHPGLLAEAARLSGAEVKPIILPRLAVGHSPSWPEAWQREFSQRNAVLFGLADLPDDTVVLLSDADEIPGGHPGGIAIPLEPGELPDWKIQYWAMDFYYYNWTWQVAGVWRGTRACTLKTLRGWGPQRVRVSDGMPALGGWHASYFGTPAEIARKLKSYAHSEYNRPPYTDEAYIAACIAEGRDLFGRPEMQLRKVRIMTGHPSSVAQAEWERKRNEWEAAYAAT
jgi:beta-1,4-mannosyl-glycoprotein beta-1,4-N-acetylglucosaminyltransferase